MAKSALPTGRNHPKELANYWSESKKCYEVPLELFNFDARQPRKTFPQEELDALARELARDGIRELLRVQVEAGKIVIVSGERRIRAARLTQDSTVRKRLGFSNFLTKAPCRLEPGARVTEQWLIEDQVAVNESSQHLTRLDLADSIHRWMTLLKAKEGTKPDLRTVAQRFPSVGGPQTIRMLLAFRTLAPEVKAQMNKKRIDDRAGKALLRIADPTQQMALAAALISGSLTIEALEREAGLGPNRGKDTSSDEAPGKDSGKGRGSKQRGCWKMNSDGTTIEVKSRTRLTKGQIVDALQAALREAKK